MLLQFQHFDFTIPLFSAEPNKRKQKKIKGNSKQKEKKTNNVYIIIRVVIYLLL